MTRVMKALERREMGMIRREMGTRGACPCPYSVPSSSEHLLILGSAQEWQELFHGLGTEGELFLILCSEGQRQPCLWSSSLCCSEEAENEPSRAGVHGDWITPVFSPQAVHFGSCLHWNRYRATVLTLWGTGAAPQPGWGVLDLC